MTMMTALTASFGRKSSIMVSAKAGVPASDASLNEGKSQGRDRALQRAVALAGDIPPVERRAQIDQTRVNPIQQARTLAAMGPGCYSAEALHAHFLDANSGYAPGPKPASVMIAETKYLVSRDFQS